MTPVGFDTSDKFENHCYIQSAKQKGTARQKGLEVHNSITNFYPRLRKSQKHG